MDLLKKSVDVLKNLQVSNGGLLATPKDGAYPYVYTRDGVIMAKALNAAGMTERAENFFHYVNKFSKLDRYGDIFHRYNANGYPCVTRKHEHDCTGLVLHGLLDTFRHNGKTSFIELMWPLINKCVKNIFSYSKTGLVRTERSIHELYRLENGYEIWANSACVRGLYDAAEMADALDRDEEKKKWTKKAKDIEKKMKSRLFHKDLKIYIKNTKYPDAPDISQLSPFYFELEKSKQMLKRTMKYLREHIWYKEIGGFRRFRKFEICKDWHWYTGGSGSWAVFTLWGARFYRELKMKKEERECREWIREIASKTKGLLPEHVATKQEYEMWKAHEIEFNSRILKGMKKTEKMRRNDLYYWATPLGWSHAEYILLNKRR